MKKFLFILYTLLFSSLAHGQSFKEVTETSGLHTATHSNGIAVADYDLDGDLDVYIVGADRYNALNEDTWNRLFSNNGNGTYSDVTEPANVRAAVNSPFDGFEGAQFGAAWGDYDNDGDPDLFLTNLGYNILYRNNGDGTFSNVTETAGVKGRENDHNSSVCWWDYDLDGDLDLYVSAWIGENIMYENNGQGTFTDVTAQSGLGDKNPTWTSLPFDANNDHLPDLYVANDFTEPNKLYLNKGDKTFVDATKEFGLQDAGHGMGLALGDYNNDGFFDIYLTNISNVVPCPLFENQGNGTFINKAKDAGVSNSGWAWGNEFFDFDHDGGLDLYVVNGHREETGVHYNFLFYNLLESDLVTPDLRGPYFWDISDSSNVNSVEIARALVTFDHDEDGDLDMLVGNKWTHPHLFENQSVTKNWLKVKLQGTVSNRNAFGATIKIVCKDKKYYRSNDGVDFLGQSILPLHFGIGDAEYIDTLTVRWPGGQQESVTNIEANKTVTIAENQGLVSAVNDITSGFVKPQFRLNGNYPNPFNNQTRIVFHAPHQGFVRFKVFDSSGHEVFSSRMAVKKNINTITWYGYDDKGNSLSSGLYFYQITFSSRETLYGKLLYIK